MNNVVLKGFLKDKTFSHKVGDVEYEKASLICPGVNGREDDVLSIRYKKLTCKYNEGDFISLKGNLRSYSRKEENKNTVELYVFTYFDLPDMINDNLVEIDGRICKIGQLQKSKSGKEYLHFILANNIIIRDDKKINNYISCTAYGELARKMAVLNVNDRLSISGEFHSHTYRKKVNDEIEFRIAHEVVVIDFRS